MDELYLERLNRICREMENASEGRYPLPKIIAVTKTHPVSMIQNLDPELLPDIGENHVQEIREKAPLLGGNFRIHMIGRLQTNKVKYIMENVHLIQSMDRMELAEEIHRQALRHEKVMPVLLQVSPCGEPQKGGCPLEETEDMLRKVSQLSGLHVTGLMAVMPNTGDTDLLDSLFARMRLLFEQMRDTAVNGVDMSVLSMGMSHDYTLAARHGATMVRIGSALFGPRG